VKAAAAPALERRCAAAKIRNGVVEPRRHAADARGDQPHSESV